MKLDAKASVSIVRMMRSPVIHRNAAMQNALYFGRISQSQRLRMQLQFLQLCPEDPREDRIDVLVMIGEVELVLNLCN
jgi:hypothetical protein